MHDDYCDENLGENSTQIDTRTEAERKAAELAHMTRVLSYENEKLLAQLMRELNISRETAFVLFHGLKQFLYLLGTDRNHGQWHPPQMIDRAWHCFLLRGEFDYGLFGRKYFHKEGRLHHNPDIEAELGWQLRVQATIAEAYVVFGDDISRSWRW